MSRHVDSINMIDLKNLPNEAEKLKSIIRFQVQNYDQAIQAIQNHEAEIQSKEIVIQARDAEIGFLQEALRDRYSAKHNGGMDDSLIRKASADLQPDGGGSAGFGYCVLR